jgi:beta-glucanase (GH16 family)
MEKIKILLFILLVCSSAVSQVMWQLDKDSVITWFYQEGDEFNGDSLNKKYWSDWYGWGRSIVSNKEQQYYSRWKNHFLRNGILSLTAKRENISARFVDHMNDNDSIISDHHFYGLNKRNFTYTAGMIQSLKDFQYGYYEIKFKIPEEGGFWPAFWLYGGRPNEEIDWMELKTEKPEQIHVGRHCQNRKDNYVKGFMRKKVVWGDWIKFKGSLNKGYNIVAGEWTPHYLKYYLNGECIAIAFTEMNVPKKLVANIAVASKNGSFHPGPREDFKDSVSFEIDYIRVWNRSEYAAKRVSGRQTKIESLTGPKEISHSELVSKSKVHYGGKSLHSNEGVFVSFMRESNSRYQFTVLGKEIPKDARYTLKDASGKIILSEKLDFGQSSFDLGKYTSNEMSLEVQANGKKESTNFTLIDFPVQIITR